MTEDIRIPLVCGDFVGSTTIPEFAAAFNEAAQEVHESHLPPEDLARATEFKGSGKIRRVLLPRGLREANELAKVQPWKSELPDSVLVSPVRDDPGNRLYFVVIGADAFEPVERGGEIPVFVDLSSGWEES